MLTAWHKHLKKQGILKDYGESFEHKWDWVFFAKQPADDSDRVTQNVSPGEEILSLKTMRLLFSHFFQGSY